MKGIRFGNEHGHAADRLHQHGAQLIWPLTAFLLILPHGRAGPWDVPGGAFGAEYGPILALATGMFVLYGVLSLPQGWLAARVGRKTLIATLLPWHLGFR